MEFVAIPESDLKPIPENGFGSVLSSTVGFDDGVAM
jgi:hypothetical protein